MFSQSTLSENIKKHRTRLGISQRELADRTGVSVQAVSKWERGNSAPELVTVCELARIFSVSVDELLRHDAPEMSAFIGIDGGGTKTEFLLFLPTGEVLGRTLLPSTNPNAVGMETTHSVLERGINSLLSMTTSPVVGIYAGIAGMLSADNKERVESFLKERYPSIPSSVSTDIYNVMASAVECERCVAAIAGTGSVVYAKVGNEIHRFGGWGYILDEGGSGFDLGRDALRAALRDNEGTGRKTRLTELIENHLCAKAFDKIPELYGTAPSSIAAIAPLVFEAARLGDRVATEIIRDSFSYLARRITSAIEKFDTGNTVVISGGLMSASDMWLPALKSALPPDTEIVIPTLPQIFGTCRLALSHFGGGAVLDEDKFISEYKKIKDKQEIRK